MWPSNSRPSRRRTSEFAPSHAHHEASPCLPLAALGILQPGVDEVAVVDQPLERDAEAHVDAGMAGDLRAQDSLELGLVEGHQHRVAVDDAGRADAREATEQRRVVLHLRDRDGRELAVAHADQLQDAQGLVVERDGARLGEDLGGLVDRQHADAVAAEQVRQRGADRPEADDQHVDVLRRGRGRAGRRSFFSVHARGGCFPFVRYEVRHARSLQAAVMTVVCSPRSSAPSSVRIEALMRSPGRR